MTLPPSDDPEVDIRITRANLDYWYGEAQRLAAQVNELWHSQRAALDHVERLEGRLSRALSDLAASKSSAAPGTVDKGWTLYVLTTGLALGALATLFITAGLASIGR